MNMSEKESNKVQEDNILTKDNYWNFKEKYKENELSKMVFSHLGQNYHNRSQQKSKERQGKIKFYPSSIGKSDHDIVLEMMGYLGKPSRGEGLMIMENGTSFHNRIEHIFEEMGIMIAPELSLKDEELHISGRSDAIVWNYLKEEDEPDGEEITLIDPSGKVIYKGPENYVLLVEFKSISENGYEKLKVSKPKQEHEDQLQLYFYLTGITKGMVYYENKNNQKVKEYIIERDEERIDFIVKRIRRLIEMVKNKEVPEPEYTPGDFEGRFSNFLDFAYPNMNPVEFADLFVKKNETEDELPF